MRFCFLLLTLLVLATSLHAEPPAGAVLYFQQGDEVYVLMADHDTNRGWAAFGGGASAGETIAQTAARETEEETRGYFSRADLEKRMTGLKPFEFNGFHLYFIEVPYAPAQRIANQTPPNENPDYLERGPYAWVPFSELERLLPDKAGTAPDLDPLYLPGTRQTDHIWEVWIASIRAADAAGALPWKPGRAE